MNGFISLIVNFCYIIKRNHLLPLLFLKIRTHVGSGTYIRTLAEDIGDALGCNAYTTELRRTKIADYDIAKLPLFPLPE